MVWEILRNCYKVISLKLIKNSKVTIYIIQLILVTISEHRLFPLLMTIIYQLNKFIMIGRLIKCNLIMIISIAHYLSIIT